LCRGTGLLPATLNLYADLVGGANDSKGCLVCPWHGARYDVKTGRMVLGPAGRLRRRSRLCRVVGLDTSSLEDRVARVSTRVVTRILALAEQLARDPWVGLHAGERAEPRGPVFYLILSSPRIAEGLRRAERFCGLAVDTLRLTVRSEREVASVIFDVGDAAFSRSRHAMEYLL
jgi:Arabinose-binding domain of AraC transcription regulator, N-term/Rieske [2Fe-2S] domain